MGVMYPDCPITKEYPNFVKKMKLCSLYFAFAAHFKRKYDSVLCLFVP